MDTWNVNSIRAIIVWVWYNVQFEAWNTIDLEVSRVTVQMAHIREKVDYKSEGYSKSETPKVIKKMNMLSYAT